MNKWAQTIWKMILCSPHLLHGRIFNLANLMLNLYIMASSNKAVIRLNISLAAHLIMVKSFMSRSILALPIFSLKWKHIDLGHHLVFMNHYKHFPCRMYIIVITTNPQFFWRIHSTVYRQSSGKIYKSDIIFWHENNLFYRGRKTRKVHI